MTSLTEMTELPTCNVPRSKLTDKNKMITGIKTMRAIVILLGRFNVGTLPALQAFRRFMMIHHRLSMPLLTWIELKNKIARLFEVCRNVRIVYRKFEPGRIADSNVQTVFRCELLGIPFRQHF